MSNTKQALFSPVKIGKNQLKHRVVLSPVSRLRATFDGTPSENQLEYYTQRANEGGLLITEATFISRLAGGFPYIPGIYSQKQIKEWRKITRAVHDKNGFIYCQLWHLGRVGSSKLNPHGEQVVSASAIRVSGISPQLKAEYETPRALELSEIKSIVQEYRQAALNAIEAGFDGVEIHAAFGYLIDQFVNSSSNQRTDAYGGSIENRARFALEIVDEVVDAIGADRTAIRFSPGETFQQVQDDTPIETWSYITSQLQQNHPDLAYLHFIECRSNVHQDEVCNSEDSLKPFRTLWKGPFVSAGGFSTNIQHALELAEKTGDLISFGRAFIANPDLPQRLMNNWPLNKYDRSTFYTHEAVGYTDYPFYNEN